MQARALCNSRRWLRLALLSGPALVMPLPGTSASPAPWVRPAWAQAVAVEADHGGALGETLPTPAEAARYLAYTRYGEMVAFLSTLDARAAEITLESIAPLPRESSDSAGSEPPQLFLVTARAETENGDDPVAEPADGNKVSVLIVAAQHGDEQSGKEATLRLLRDLVIGPLRPLLERIDVYAIPMPNPWGVEAGERENASGIDLNRDHGLLGTAAVAAIHRFFAERRPEVVLDVHELGLAAYDAEIGLPTHPMSDSALISFARYRVLPYVVNQLGLSGFSFHEYVVATSEEGSVEDPSEAFFSYGPLFVSYARNAFALEGAMSFLVEASSSREIYDLELRTAVQYTVLRAILEAIAEQAEEVRLEVEAARARADGPSRVGAPPPVAPDTLVLRAQYTTNPSDPELTWLVREREGLNVRTTDAWRSRIMAELIIERPVGFIIPPEEQDVVRMLRRHGVLVRQLAAPRELRLGRYPVRGQGMPEPLRGVHEGVETRETEVPAGDEPEAEVESGADSARTEAGQPDSLLAAPDGPRPPAEVAAVDRDPLEPINAAQWVEWVDLVMPAGTFWVDADQPGALLLLALLEPYSQDSWYATDAAGLSPDADYYPVYRTRTRPGEGWLKAERR